MDDRNRIVSFDSGTDHFLSHVLGVWALNPDPELVSADILGPTKGQGSNPTDADRGSRSVGESERKGERGFPPSL